jgi:D-glycero-alpha-D-manno-heptose-7-phosphate kinase
MIVTRTPLRISFAGGGSDYASFFAQEPGCVVGAAINQFIYVSVMPLPIFAEEEHRFTYRITESVQNVSEFKHPVVRTVLQEIKTTFRTNISTMANLPGRSGLGSSSSFTVGLINGIQNLLGVQLSPEDLAQAAIKIERDILGEPGGLQDQYHASFGGLNTYKFFENGKVTVSEASSNQKLTEAISKRLILIPMAKLRDSSKFAELTDKKIKDRSKFALVRDMADLARELHGKLTSSSLETETKISFLVDSINYGWDMKSSLAGDYLGKSTVAELISTCLKMGASAARLCGAGGSGFILLVSEEGMREKLVRDLSYLNAFPIEICNSGSELVVSEAIEYSKLGVVEKIR